MARDKRKGKALYIVVGLGNPEAKYTYTRHNAGFLAIDRLCERWGIDLRKQHCQALVGEGRFGTERVVLAKPLTYMNRSGQAVVDLLNWYKIEQEDELIVLYDDIDLDVGKIRLRAKGSAGTHNGMKSILYLTGSDCFPRVRIGVGGKPAGWDLADHVLSSFQEEEKDEFWNSLDKTADAVELIVQGKLLDAQNLFNEKKKKKEKEPAPEEKE